MQPVINVLKPCNLTIHPGPEVMPSRMQRSILGTLFILLASCAEPVPETSMDGVFTAQQAERGAAIFDSLCSRCHSVQEFSGNAFDATWAGVPAAALYVRIANTMPLDQPGSLSLDQVTALMSHIFNANGMPPGDTPLPDDMDFMLSITLARPTQ